VFEVGGLYVFVLLDEAPTLVEAGLFALLLFVGGLLVKILGVVFVLDGAGVATFFSSSFLENNFEKKPGCCCCCFGSSFFTALSARSSSKWPATCDSSSPTGSFNAHIGHS